MTRIYVYFFTKTHRGPTAMYYDVLIGEIPKGILLQLYYSARFAFVSQIEVLNSPERRF